MRFRNHSRHPPKAPLQADFNTCWLTSYLRCKLKASDFCFWHASFPSMIGGAKLCKVCWLFFVGTLEPRLPIATGKRFRMDMQKEEVSEWKERTSQAARS